MKILMVNRTLFASSAAEAVMFTLAEQLEKLGHEVGWFARDHERNQELPDSYVVNRCLRDSRRQSQRRRIFDRDAADAMKERIRDDRPDLALIWNLGDLTWSVVQALRDKKVPTYVMLLDYGPVCLCHNLCRKGRACKGCQNKSFLYPVFHCCVQGDRRATWQAVKQEKYRRQRKLYDKPNGYVCASEYQADMMRKAAFTTKPIINLELPLVMPEEEQKKEKNNTFFLYAGTMEERKGVKTLLRAMSQTVSDVTLILAGEGPEFREMRELAEELEVEHKVRFMGKMPASSLRQNMKDCLCIVVPSECEEIAPWPLLEAQSYGKPAVVASTGVLQDRVIDGENGLVFLEKNASMLAEALDEIADMKEEEYLAMSDKARKMALERYDIRAYAEAILNLPRYEDTEFPEEDEGEEDWA